MLVLYAQALPSSSDHRDSLSASADADFNGRIMLSGQEQDFETSVGTLEMPLAAPKLTEIGADDRLILCQDESDKQCHVCVCVYLLGRAAS